MKVLQSTDVTQGKRKSDFCFVPEGELVKYGSACDRDNENIDGDCGCRRSFVGVNCMKATTTARVVSVKMTEEEYCLAMFNSDVKAGWIRKGADDKELQESCAERKKEALDLLKVADFFKVGEIVEKRGIKIRSRIAPGGQG